MQVGRDKSFNPSTMGQGKAHGRNGTQPGKMSAEKPSGALEPVATNDGRKNTPPDVVDIDSKTISEDVKAVIARAEASRLELVDTVRQARFSQASEAIPGSEVGSKDEDPFETLRGVVSFFSNANSRDTVYRVVDHSALLQGFHNQLD